MAGRSTSATTTLLRDLNERTVLEAIRAERPISRAEISRRVGISKPTVSLALQSLLEAGLVRETSHDPGRPELRRAVLRAGRRGRARARHRHRSALPAGGLCDLDGVVVAREDVEHAGADVGGVLDIFVGLAARLIDASGVSAERLDGVVVGVPGVVAPDGLVQLAENVPGLEGMVVADELARTARASGGRSRTTSTSPRSASSGAGSRPGSTTSRSCRSAPASAAGWCSEASSTAATTARPARSTSPRAPGSGRRSIRARARSPARRPACRRGALDHARAAVRRALDLRLRARRRCGRAGRRRRGGPPHRAAHLADRGGRRRRARRARGRHRRQRRSPAAARARASWSGSFPIRRGSRSRASAMPRC